MHYLATLTARVALTFRRLQASKTVPESREEPLMKMLTERVFFCGKEEQKARQPHNETNSYSTVVEQRFLAPGRMLVIAVSFYVFLN